MCNDGCCLCCYVLQYLAENLLVDISSANALLVQHLVARMAPGQSVALPNAYLLQVLVYQALFDQSMQPKCQISNQMRHATACVAQLVLLKQSWLSELCLQKPLHAAQMMP